MQEAPRSTARGTSTRLGHIDALRGAAIVLMALDHCRDFFQPAGASPEALDSTTWPFFLTRWLTHFCAPVFIFLAGTSAAIVRDRRGVAALRRFLLTRGLWLMALELTWVTFSWFFDFHILHLGVLWGIGGAFVLLAALVSLDGRVILGLGVTGTLLLTAFPVGADAPLAFLVRPTYHHDLVLGRDVANVYVVLPWLCVMAVGFGLAPLLRDPTRRRQLVAVGVSMTGAFLALRAANGFGDPSAWAIHERGAGVTAMAFLNCSKYPPSLCFQLMTLGPALALLPLLDGGGRLREWLRAYGRVPLFFYLLHIPLLHGLGVLHAQMRYGADRIPEGVALSLPLIWGVWLLVTLALLPACRVWGRLKAERRHPLLAYL